MSTNPWPNFSTPFTFSETTFTYTYVSFSKDIREMMVVRTHLATIVLLWNLKLKKIKKIDTSGDTRHTTNIVPFLVLHNFVYSNQLLD